MRITNLSKRFGEFSLHIDEMRLEDGKIYGLIGSNGCGKTTLSKLITGLLPPDGGSIDYEGLTARDLTLISRRPYLLHDSVYENLIYPLKLRKIKPDEDEVNLLLKLAGLSDKRRHNALTLSGGEQQKLALIRALIFSPRLVVLDEGMSNLDIESVSQFEDYLLHRQKKRSTTWLIISHRLSHIARLCEHVFFMDKGALVAQGETGKMLLNPQNEALIRYLRSEIVELPREI